ncbi:gamma-crystallin S-1-like [Cebidichthys violaceus]|uniref:gamma-crystallin S-1-like n=1 Tax=Cebidichthys violaceus TaxID=271503 RepID=UPI0035CB5D14
MYIKNKKNLFVYFFKIIFYEDRNFQGRFHECDNDSSDLHTYISRCNSIRVEGGFWVTYERPNYMGYQYALSPGEYPDYQRWLGINDTIRSCRIIRNVGNSWRLKVWVKANFEGQTMELADNMPVFHERWHSRDVHSCKVFEGAWIFYEHPNYRGRQYLLERGEYRRYSEWGGVQPTVGSIRRVKENSPCHSLKSGEKAERTS